MKEISVIMHVSEWQPYIKKAIDSILAQTYPAREFLIVDDTTDKQLENNLAAYGKSKISILKNRQPLGMAASLNLAIEAAKGDYIARMDADDISLPERLAKQVDFLENNPDIDICGSWVKTFGAKNEIWKYPTKHEEIIARLLFASPMIHPTIIFRKESFSKFNLKYDERYPFAQDYELWTRVAEKGLKFANLPQILLYYRIDKEKKQSAREKRTELANEIREKLLLNWIPDLTENQLALHNSIANGSFPKKTNTIIEETRKWFKYILRQNKKQNRYEERILVQILALYWFLTISRLSWRDLLGSPGFYWSSFFYGLAFFKQRFINCY